MLLSNNILKPTYKVWVYTSNNAFTNENVNQIHQFAQQFLSSWESHGAPVIGGIEVLYNRFVVIYADDCDGHLCGRAQDAQVRFIKELEVASGLSLMNRMLVAYRTQQNEVQALPMSEFTAYLKTLTHPNELVVYDNTVTTMGAFQSNWETPLHTTWMARLVS